MTRGAVIVAAAVASFVTMPAAPAQTPIVPCQRGPADPSGVYVNLNNETNAQTIAHARAAVERGQPRILHWSPALNDERRRLSLRGHPVVHGKDRDEYPPAATEEGGAGADVLPIDPGDNRSAGTRMNNQMNRYCEGTAFILEP